MPLLAFPYKNLCCFFTEFNFFCHSSSILLPHKWNSRFTATKVHHQLTGLRLANLATPAYAHAADDFRLQDTQNIDFLVLMEQHGIRANHQTFLWLLDDCFKNAGSLHDGKRLHGKLLKLGFDNQHSLCEKLIDVYVSLGDLDSAASVFDEMPQRSVFSGNKIMYAFSEKKLTSRVLNLFLRMVMDNVNPNETTYNTLLRAYNGGDIPLNIVQQIHARIKIHGFGSTALLCNTLIDLYFKIDSIDSAKQIFNTFYLKDSTTWVAMMSGLSRIGCEEEAIFLFCNMHRSGVLPTPYIFSSVLSACSKLESFKVGEQLHTLVFKFGFSSATYICNALLTLYLRSGNLLSAEQIFHRMSERDSVTYNSIISELSQYGYGDKAMELFRQMQFDCLKPDCITIASLVSACASVGALVKGQQLHSHIIKSGCSSDIIVEGSLLDLYAKCSDIETMQEYFLTTKTENVVLWNVMLVGYGNLNNLSDSFRIFRQMQIEGIIPNQFTYPSILKTCTSVGALDLGEQIHTQVIKTGFQVNVYVCSVLIDMYAKLGNLDMAAEILQRFAGKDVVSWTAMIAGYTQNDLHAKALKTFQEMLDRGINSDNIGFSSAVSACAGLQALNQGRQIHAQSCVSGYSYDYSIQNALVSLYSRCGRTKEAYLAFEKSEAKDNISWNALLSGFAQSGYCEEALRIFSQMNKAGISPNYYTFGSVVSAAANTANAKQGKQIHGMIIKTGYNLETEVSNALITLYAKCGCIADAKRQFSEIPKKNNVSWNAMITCYSQHGCGSEALDFFQMMKQQGTVPNHVTFLGVLSASSHVGLVNKGLQCFESMKKEYGLVPKPEHYVCVVDLLSRAGFLSRAKEFIEDMPIEPDATIWRTLLSACTVHKNIEIGEFAARHLLEVEPEDSATYVLVSNLYSVVRKWDARDQTRQLMKRRGVKKEPGRSWIEVKSSIHAFFVGDQLHPLKDNIYAYLEDLNKRAAETGYVQDRSSLLNEEEQEHKNPVLSTHSEKLAITFGLLSLTSTLPIHVIKNLRVCNDCHNWIKSVSKLSNRAIVVRDAYRFHHFEDGLCSCKDYW